MDEAGQTRLSGPAIPGDAMGNDSMWWVARLGRRVRPLPIRCRVKGGKLLALQGRTSDAGAPPRARARVRRGTLAGFFASSPSRGSGLVTERMTGIPRQIDR
jgi:hypothetical protein